MESTHFHTIGAEGIRATLDLRAGHVRTLEIARAGRKIQPLHTASWVDDPAIHPPATHRSRSSSRVSLSASHGAAFPITMMWFSNGGRDYAPWNGRHRGLLELQESRTYGGHGHRASINDNPWTRLGIATALALNPMGEVEVRDVIGGVARPDGWSKVAVPIAGPSQVTLTDAGGATLSMPFDGAFLRTGR